MKARDITHVTLSAAKRLISCHASRDEAIAAAHADPRAAYVRPAYATREIDDSERGGSLMYHIIIPHSMRTSWLVIDFGNSHAFARPI